MGNTFGKIFRITTFGESHGNGVGVVIDGVKPNFKLSLKQIQYELNRRKPNQSNITTSRNETDEFEILSGVLNNETLGTPICVIVKNKDAKSSDYKNLETIFRPSHGEFSYFKKYGIVDFRGGGRSSARETIGRVIAGAIAKQILSKKKIEIIAHTKQVGNIIAKTFSKNEIEKNFLRCGDSVVAKKMEKKILQLKSIEDSIGGVVECIVQNFPSGIGEPVFDKLESELAKAMLSIPAVKGFEIGSGFNCALMKGSEHNDEFYFEKKTNKIKTKTNFAGGVLGGISTGEEIIFRVAVKPPSSIAMKQKTVNKFGENVDIKILGRHDACICPRVVPVVEAMCAITLLDLIFQNETIK